MLTIHEIVEAYEKNIIDHESYMELIGELLGGHCDDNRKAGD